MLVASSKEEEKEKEKEKREEEKCRMEQMGRLLSSIGAQRDEEERAYACACTRARAGEKKNFPRLANCPNRRTNYHPESQQSVPFSSARILAAPPFLPRTMRISTLHL